MKTALKFMCPIFIFIFLTNSFYAQGSYIVHHRYVLQRDMNVTFPPEFYVEVGKPRFFTGDTTLTADFLFHPFSGWQPNNYIEAIRCLETDTVTLISNTTTINFAFGFHFIDIDSLLDPDSTLHVQYQIIDVDSQICREFALETQIFNPFFLRDSFSGQYCASYIIQGNRTHTFTSYPGQRVITGIYINWSAIKDTVSFTYGMGQINYHISSYQNSNFVTNILPYTLDNTITKISENKILPTSVKLNQNYPNPFNPSTTISFDLTTDVHVRLDIFDITGRKICTLVNEPKEAGTHQVIWNGQDDHGNSVASGLYVFRIHAGNFVQSKKMLFMK